MQDSEFSDEMLLIDENQCGFRSGYSTTDCMFVLHSFFEILKNKKKKLFCAFVEFEKAFDTVWRDALWYKMLLNNILNGNVYQVIFNMYQNIKSCLFYDGNKSEYFPCEIGSDKGKMYPLFYTRYF